MIAWRCAISKRFTDTNKFKKKFHRSLPGPYKLLWDYLYHECDHAGIWHVDFEVAQIYLGADMVITETEALRLFNSDADDKKITVLNGGTKWFIPSFIDFQYGHLNPSVKAHASVISILSKEGIKLYENCLRTVMDMDMDMDKDKDKDKAFEQFWNIYPHREGVKTGKPETRIEFNKLTAEELPKFLQAANNFSELKKKDKIGIPDPIRFLIKGRGKEKIRPWLEFVDIAAPKRWDS